MNVRKAVIKPHYQILDGLRGVAAIIVVFFHLAETFGSAGLITSSFIFMLPG